MRIAFWRKPALPEGQRQALERWACGRLHMFDAHPMEAIIGAVGRLTEAGMSANEAADTVLRIMRETKADSE